MNEPVVSKPAKKDKLAKRLVGGLGVLVIGGILCRSPIAREGGVSLLGRVGPSAVPLILKSMQDENAGVRITATWREASLPSRNTWPRKLQTMTTVE